MRTFSVGTWLLWASCTSDPAGDKVKDETDQGPVDGDADVDADSDTDSDTDTDADTDSDTDTDTVPVFGSFDAQILYEETFDGATWCSTALSLEGTPYTGPCPGCEFAFDVVSTVTSSTGTDCVLEPPLTWQVDERFASPRIAFSSSFTDYVPWGRTYTNILWFSAYFYPSSYYYYYGGTGPIGPIWYMVANDEDPNLGKATFDGTALEWEFSDADPYHFIYTSYLDYCSYTTYSPGYGPFSGASTREELGCTESMLDVWEFTANANDPIRISVDTPDPLATFAPYLRLTDDTGCVLAYSYGTVPCTSSYDPYAYFEYCPSIDFIAPTTGTYRIVVMSAGGWSCPSGEGLYDLVMESPNVGIAQIADEEIRELGPFAYTLDVRMFGSVSP